MTAENDVLLRIDLQITQEELFELEKACKMPIVFDEDCPETTPKRAIKFRRVNPPRDKSTQI